MHFLTMILRSIARRRTRAALTVGAMAMAVGAFVTLVGIAGGFERSFMEIYNRAKVDLLVMRAGGQERLNSALDLSLRDKLRQVPGVREITPTLVDFVSLEQYGLYSVCVQGFEPDAKFAGVFEVVAGRQLDPADSRGVLIGKILAMNLEKKVGDQLEIYEDEKYQIVGVYETYNSATDGMIMVLLPELQRLMDRPGKVTGFSLELENAEDPDVVAEAARKIEELDRSLAALTPAQHVGSVSQLAAVRGMAWLTSGIGLLIGTIGVLNTMFMSVFERTREIGVLRAIGWRKSRIVRMILGESLLLSLAGGAVGSVGAILFTRFLSRLPAVNGMIEGDVSPLIVGEAFLIAAVVGLVGAAYPAYRGAKLLPTEALRRA